MPPAWKSAFTAASRDVDGNYIAGEISIEDVVMDRVRDILLASTVPTDDGTRPNKLEDILEGRIYVIEGPFGGSIGTAPLIYIWTANTTEDQAPTGIGLNLVRVFIGVLWRTQEIQVKAFGQPSVASIVSYVKGVLRAPKNRQLVEMVEDEERPLAKRGQLGSVDFTEVVLDAENRGHALMQFDWLYNVDTNLASDIIHNLET